MSFAKKAASIGVSAAMLATLIGTALAPSVFAVTGVDQQTYWNSTTILNGCSTTGTSGPDNGATSTTSAFQCSQVADGASRVAVFFGPFPLDSSVTGQVNLTVSGATFDTTDVPASTAANVGTWTYGSSSSLTIAAASDILSGNYVVLVAPATAGTATITVSYFTSGSLTAQYGGVYTVAFTSASNLALNVSASYVGVTLGSCPTSTTTNINTSSFKNSASATASNPVGCVNALLTNGSGQVVTGASVTFTIQPVGLVGTGQTATVSDSQLAFTVNNSASPGWEGYFATLSDTGLTGTSTITTTVSYRGVSYTLPNVTFSFFGDLAKIALTSVTASAIDAPTSDVEVADYAATDASGVSLGCPTYTVSGLALVGATPTVGALSNGDCGILLPKGSSLNDGTYTVSVSGTTSTGATITSNAVTFVVSDGTAKTVTVVPAATTVAPAGQLAVKVTVLDDNGTIMPDGTTVTLVASQGAVVGTSSSGGVNTDELSDGVANFLYLSQTASGPVTLSAIAGGVAGSASVTVGAAAPVTTATSGTALGVTKTGPFSISTKIPAVGKYVTWKFSFGASAAGQTVSILRAAKSSSGMWSSFSGLTTRIADSNGDVYFYWRVSSPAWLSFEAQLGTTMTPARQARWL